MFSSLNCISTGSECIYQKLLARVTYVFFASQLRIAVGEVARLSLRAVARLHKVLADLRLVEQGDRLRLRGLLAARGRVDLVVVDFGALATRHRTVRTGLLVAPHLHTLLL